MRESEITVVGEQRRLLVRRGSGAQLQKSYRLLQSMDRQNTLKYTDRYKLEYTNTATEIYGQTHVNIRTHA